MRFRNRQGRLCKVRATTRDIRALTAGLLPAVVEARRPEQKKFRPLLTFHEFHDVQPAPPGRRASGRLARAARAPRPPGP